jgi:multiple sugar transport system substrate-binding protein
MSLARRSRRAILRSLAGVGSAAFVAACGGGSNPQPVTRGSSFVQEPDASATPVVRRDLSGEITVAYADELGKKPAYVEKAAAALERGYAGVSVTIRRAHIGGSEFFDQLLPSLSADDAPDVIHVGGDRLGELADAGLIVPLDEYLRDWPDWRYYSPTVRDGVTYQNQVWAIPYGLDTRFLYFRRDIFEQAGLPGDWQPKNVADILAAAARIRAQRPDVIPYALYAGPTGGTGTANHGFVPLVYAYGGSLKDSRGLWIGDSPAIRKAFGFYARAFQAERVVPLDLLSTPRSWVAMRERLGDGRLAILYEGGWVYGGWADKDRAGTTRNVGYLLFPMENDGPSFTIGGPGTCWFITAASRNKRLAWEFIVTWNNRDTVGRLNAEDPHPVARVDAVRVPEYRGDKFLVDSTESLRRAHFIPPDAAYGRVMGAIQTTTASVAAGEATPDEAARRYAADLRQVVGDARVVVQS